jgi:AraC family transcriptional regulator
MWPICGIFWIGPDGRLWPIARSATSRAFSNASGNGKLADQGVDGRAARESATMDGGVTNTISVPKPPAPSGIAVRGFQVTLSSLPPGLFRFPASANHALCLIVGNPVRCTGRVGGKLQRWVQGSGDMEVIPAGLPGVWEDDDPAEMLTLALSPEFLGRIAEGMERYPDRVELRHQFQVREPRIEHIGWAMKAELDSGLPEERLYVEGLATAMTAHLLRHYDVAVDTQPQGLSKRQQDRVIDYIDAHIDADLSLATLAAIAGIGTTHFQALFKQSLGMSVHQYVVRRRVEHARRSLLRGDRSIAEVALDAGFAHQSHLSRWMQRLLGVTPAALLRDRGLGQIPIGSGRLSASR